MTNPVYTATKIASICQGQITAADGFDPVILDILIDSRRLIHPDGCMFVALATEINDGHRYISELYLKGVRIYLVDKDQNIDFNDFPEACFIRVENTLAALQQLAGHHRKCFSYPVIGITGSNGKTIVKEWLFQLLSGIYHIIRSPKSYNSQIGVPLSVWKMDADHTLAIFEAGISRPGEMENLEQIISPSIGILTNIGHAHDEHFISKQQKTYEKLRLFRNSEWLVYCYDNQWITDLISGNSILQTVKKFTWGREPGADVQVREVIKTREKTSVCLLFKANQYKFDIPFTDDASIENALHAVTVMILLGCSMEIIAARTPGLVPIAMRLELKEAINHCSLINDSYNSDVNSLVIALDFLQQQQHHSKRTVILSDILQTGKDKEELFREISGLLESRRIDRIIGIGRDMVKFGHHFPMEHRLFHSTDEFIAQFPLSSFQHESILLKGARIFEFERISQLLQQKTHETVMEINLDALTHNLNYFRSLLDPGTQVMAMVKAFSYGSGSFEIAHVLQYHHVDYLAVAYADEGVELRNAGIRLPVMVMSPESQSLELLLKYNLEPEIYNLHILGLLEEAIDRHVTSIQQEIRIHIKLDTGMHRLGFQEGDLDPLIARLMQNPGLRVQSIFSHLASSEEPSDDPFSRMQMAQFEKMSGKIRQAIPYPVLLHLLNSAGIARFPEARYNMVRLGIGLYGVGHNENEQERLRNVSSLRSVITQIKMVSAGETIGYNRKWIAREDMKIGIVPVGYADGLDRRLSNGAGSLFVAGYPAPIIGNICMDLTMIDLTHIPPPVQVEEGTPVVIFDDHHPVHGLSHQIGTIPYEVLTGISRRVKRIYYYE